MIFATAALAVTLVVSGFVIDTATWYQQHHQTQIAADAASLAAANCLATSAPGHTCTATTDTSDALAVAETVAAANGLTINAGNVTFAGTKVTVTPTKTAPSLFAKVAHINTVNISANAAAGFTPGTTSVSTGTVSTVVTTTGTETNTTTSTQTTTTPITGNALVEFAMDSNCSDEGIQVGGGGDSVDGGLFSNSSVWVDGGSYESINYGHGSGCGFSQQSQGNTFNDGAASAAPADLTSWPVNYTSSNMPACTSGYTSTSTGTWSIPNPPSETSPIVYCDYGSGTPGNPSTYNGTILLTGGAYDDDTFICGSISPRGGGVTLEAEGYPTNKLLIYAADSGEVVNFTNGAGTVTGDIFVPNGDIDFDSGGNGYTGLMEAQDIDNPGGGGNKYTGDGPTTYGYYTTTTVTTTASETTTTGTTPTTYDTTSTSTVAGTDGLVQ